jgi:tripartite-type tricarboxylate transporter receptor subunit TctC
MAAELLKMMTGLNMIHVPYRGTPQLMPDLLSGQVQVAVDGISTSLELIRSGKLRALAVTTATRLEALPDVPTVGEFVQGFEASGWCGVVAPKNTAVEIVDKLNNEINSSLVDPTIKARFAEMAVTVLMGSPADFGKLIAYETEKWAKVIKFANIKPD